MKNFKPTCESCVASAQLKFFCTIAELLNEYDTFLKEFTLKHITKSRVNQLIDNEIKNFSESMSKILLDSFKNLQKDVLEKVRELESDKNGEMMSVSFEFSDFSISPETPPKKKPSQFVFKTPQVKLKIAKTGTRIQTHFETEKKQRIKKRNASQTNLARCLFIN